VSPKRPPIPAAWSEDHWSEDHWSDAIEAYVESILAAGRKPSTAARQRPILVEFAAFLSARRPGITLAEVEEADVRTYLAEVASRAWERARGRHPRRYVYPYSWTLRRFFAWAAGPQAARTGRILVDPMAGMRLPRRPARLPRDVLTVEEAARLIEAPPASTPEGVRDRAILELMYSSGLRRSEVVGLDLGDVGIIERRVFVRDGKGGKDRVAPVGRRAAEWLARYVEGARPVLERDACELAFFLTQRGARVKRATVSEAIRRAALVAGIVRTVTAHTLRHTCATHMVQNGADIRQVQALLGHESLETTEVYTQIAPADLDRAHREHHPRAVASSAPSLD
jgi:integrase/recombinase XerD